MYAEMYIRSLGVMARACNLSILETEANSSMQVLSHGYIARPCQNWGGVGGILADSGISPLSPWQGLWWQVGSARVEAENFASQSTSSRQKGGHGD